MVVDARQKAHVASVYLGKGTMFKEPCCTLEIITLPRLKLMTKVKGA